MFKVNSIQLSLTFLFLPETHCERVKQISVQDYMSELNVCTLAQHVIGRNWQGCRMSLSLTSSSLSTTEKMIWILFVTSFNKPVHLYVGLRP